MEVVIATVLGLWILGAFGRGRSQSGEPDGKPDVQIEALVNKLAKATGCHSVEHWASLLANTLAASGLPGPWPPLANSAAQWQVDLWMYLRPFAMKACRAKRQDPEDAPPRPAPEFHELCDSHEYQVLARRWACMLLVAGQRRQWPVDFDSMRNIIEDALPTDVSKSWISDQLRKCITDVIKDVLDSPVQCDQVANDELIIVPRDKAKPGDYIQLQSGDSWAELMQSYYSEYNSGDQRRRVARYINRYPPNVGLGINATQGGVIGLVGPVTISFFATWRSGVTQFGQRFEPGSSFAVVKLPIIPQRVI